MPFSGALSLTSKYMMAPFFHKLRTLVPFCVVSFESLTAMRPFLFAAFVALPLINAQSISASGRCGAQFGGLTCEGSSFGDCCSKYNYCGKTTGHCGSGKCLRKEKTTSSDSYIARLSITIRAMHIFHIPNRQSFD
jgi:hypothetical protein